jgi:D-sedoheptulose 7-phosphate isomerase
MEFIQNYVKKMKDAIDTMNWEDVRIITEVLFNAYKNGKHVFILGNGGSATLASHFACDLGKGTLERIYDSRERRFRVVSLTDNVALLTAYGNDVSYDDIFSQQLNNLVNEGDIVIAITGSGNSRNVVNAMKLAKEFGAKTVSFTGFDGGAVKQLSDYNIHVNSDHYGTIEGLHTDVMHVITDYLTEMKKDEKSDIPGQGRSTEQA